MRPMLALDLGAVGRGVLDSACESSAHADAHAPARKASTSFARLDLRRVAAELLASTSGHDSTMTRTLVDDDETKVSIVALRRGTRMAEPAAPHAMVIVPIVGRLRFSTGNGVVDLSPGRSMYVGRDRLHEIIADEDAAVMLVVTA